MVPSLDEEIKSDDAGLRSRKARRIISVARLLGDIERILGGPFSVTEQKEIVVVPSSLEASPPPFTSSPLVNLGSDSISGGAPSSPGGSFQCEKPSMVDETRTLSHSLSFEAYAPGWAIARDSLLSEDTTAQE